MMRLLVAPVIVAFVITSCSSAAPTPAPVPVTARPLHPYPHVVVPEPGDKGYSPAKLPTPRKTP